MAKTCVKCGKKMSEFLHICPHCSTLQPDPPGLRDLGIRAKLILVGTMVLMVVLGFVLALVFLRT